MTTNIWPELAALAADCYRAGDLTAVDAVEFRTDHLADGRPVFIVCGTNGWRDWGCNLAARKTAASIGARRCKIHGGFWRAAHKIWPAFDAWRRNETATAAAIAGHSQGAALALLLALLDSVEPLPGRYTDVCALAPPRLGDRAFGVCFRHRVISARRRLFGRRLDPVCHFPRFGYSPTAPMTWLPSRFDGRLDHDADQYAELIASSSGGGTG